MEHEALEYISEEDSDYVGEDDDEDTEEDIDYEDMASEESSEVEIIENVVHGIGDEEQGEESGEEAEEHKVSISGDGGGSAAAAASASGSPNGFELDRPFIPNCPVCFEPWTPDGYHRVCCIPCGHLFGRSCLEKWLVQCMKNSGKCPICNGKFTRKGIVNLYAPLVAVRSDELEKELCSLREKNERLQIEKTHLLEEITKQTIMAKAQIAIQRNLCENLNYRTSSSLQAFPDNCLPSQDYKRGAFRNCILDLKNEVAVEGARVMGIDASSQIVLIAGKRPGLSGEHILSKISLLAPFDIHETILPPGTGSIRDLCMLPSGLALLASLSKNLSLFCMGSNNIVLKYDLPVPAWSCSGDYNSQYQIYTGLQNGTLLVFDIRHTARYLESREGLSMHPIHTIHSVVHNDNTRKVLTASALGPCVWDIGGSGERPFLIPGMEDQGVCIALACGSSADEMVASFRSKAAPSGSVDPISQPPEVSPSARAPGTGKMGNHVFIKRGPDSSFQRHGVAPGCVSEVRMSKSAIIYAEGDDPMFAYGDEWSRGVCLWDLPSCHIYARLKSHQQSILDLKYARSRGPGFLGCISEDRLQVFTVC